MKTKFGMRALSLLLIMALAGAVFVPAVGAEENQYNNSKIEMIEDNYISVNTACKYANLALQDFIERGMIDASWSSAKIDSNPVEVYDLNGEKLIYLFFIEKDGKNVGALTIAASKVLGSLVLTAQTVPSYIEKDTLSIKAEEYIQKNYENAKLLSMQVVCYNYPRIGLLLTIITQNGDQEQVILDAYDYSIIPESGVSSFYKEIAESDFSSHISEWENQEKYLCAIKEDKYSTKATVTETLSGFYLYPQQGTNWCSFATAQMVSRYYGYTRTQQQIAQTIGVDPDDGATVNQITNDYYEESVANGGIGKTSTYIEWTTNAQFDTVKDEIDSNHPIHTSRYEATSYHARAIAGYSYVTGSGNEYVYIYDPWPVNQGSLYWENWVDFYSGSKPVHANVYVK